MAQLQAAELQRIPFRRVVVIYERESVSRAEGEAMGCSLVISVSSTTGTALMRSGVLKKAIFNSVKVAIK